MYLFKSWKAMSEYYKKGEFTNIGLKRQIKIVFYYLLLRSRARFLNNSYFQFHYLSLFLLFFLIIIKRFLFFLTTFFIDNWKKLAIRCLYSLDSQRPCRLIDSMWTHWVYMDSLGSCNTIWETLLITIQ